uniref:Uncharacterized protein n=1 Tax=Rhinolophus ferrumequinum TaxID=59479 RepID=A0A671FGY7_RHIFE
MERCPLSYQVWVGVCGNLHLPPPHPGSRHLRGQWGVSTVNREQCFSVPGWVHAEFQSPSEAGGRGCPYFGDSKTQSRPGPSLPMVDPSSQSGLAWQVRVTSLMPHTSRGS